MEWMMRANGAASPYNPAWLVISTLYFIVKWAWLFAGAIFGAIAIGGVAQSRLEVRSRLIRIERERENEKLRELERQLERKIERRKEIVHQQQLHIKAKLDRQTKHRLAKEQREMRRRRTARGAVEAALNDFCKGGL